MTGRGAGAERILVVVRGHLGDLVQALPALRDLRRYRPEAHVTVMVNEYVRTALDGCPYVDRVIAGFAYRKAGRAAELAHQARLLAGVAGRYDTVIAMRWSPSLLPVMALLAGASVRVGYDHKGKLGGLLTHNLGPEPIDTVSNRVLNEMPLRALGIESEPSYPPIDWMPDRVLRETDSLLEASGVQPGDRVALIQMSSHWGCSEWSSDKWAALTDHLAGELGLKVVATGTGEWFERAKLESVQRRSQARLTSLLGKTSIPQLFEVVRRARLVVSGDCGVAQVALAQRTPSVVMFGIEEIEANGPRAGEEERLMRTIQRWAPGAGAPPPNPHCAFGESHCHGRFCTENSSLRSIAARDVIALVDQVMGAGVSV